MDTKQCRHCKQLIHGEARICQHCQCYQVWWANPRDPRYQILGLIVLAGMFIAFAIIFRLLVPDPDEPPTRREEPSVAVSESTARFYSATDGLHFVVLGKLQNNSRIELSGIWFRVTFLDGSDSALDSILLQQNGLLAPAGKSTQFRVAGVTVLNQSEIKRTNVVVERSKPRNKWD